jgi:hypothetical protein
MNTPTPSSKASALSRIQKSDTFMQSQTFFHPEIAIIARQGTIKDLLTKKQSVQRRWLMRVCRTRAGLLERERKTQPTIQKHFATAHPG